MQSYTQNKFVWNRNTGALGAGPKNRQILASLQNYFSLELSKMLNYPIILEYGIT